MIFRFKCLVIFVLLVLFSTNVNSNSTNVNSNSLKINYSNYIKNYYHIPSYSSVEDCMKSNFYEYIYNYPNNSNENINEIVYYKYKLEKIIDFL
jgi:hypothetical protein